ncbi:MAG: hypothetical protein ACYSR8_04145 [Planctomycetota bacterium]|jgi:hypothetical protein
MAGNNQKPTLKELSQQLFALYEDFEELAADFYYEWEGKFSEEEKQSTEKLLDSLAELLCKIYEARKIAVKTMHPSVFGQGILTDCGDAEISTFWVLGELAEFVEGVLEKYFEVVEKEEDCDEYGESLPEGHIPSRKCLIDGFYCCEGHKWGYSEVENLIEPLKDVANKLAGMFLQEQMESEQETAPARESSEEIPPERKSAPLSLSRMAQYWGGEMTSKKLRAMIESGSLKVIKINRQTFIFDTEYLPAEVIRKVKQ